jgi:hypothetical protein
MIAIAAATLKQCCVHDFIDQHRAGAGYSLLRQERSGSPRLRRRVYFVILLEYAR